jgi:hypothetical protein
MRQHFTLVAVMLLVVAPVLRPAENERAPANDTISADDLRRDVFFLASDAMRGRLTGTRENRLAAQFIRTRFADLGLRPVGPNGTYLQPFDMIVAALGATNTLDATTDGVTAAAEFGRDFYPERFSPSAQASGPLVFVGFGISAPPLGHDDYADLDITGKVAVVLDHEPGEHDPESPFDGTAASEYGRGVRKAVEAQRRGAVAVLFTSDVQNHTTRQPFGSAMQRVWPDEPSYQLAAWLDELTIPALRVSPGWTRVLVGATGESLEELARGAETPGGARPRDVPNATVTIEAGVERRRVTEHNVVGLIEGSDPELRDEWIIICAHYDHEGVQGSRIFTGADDDASGVAGLLEIAEAYALAAREGLAAPRRSILLAAWNAEEHGLLGSWAYTTRPLQPLDRTVAVINMDMIGRNEEIPTEGDGRFAGLAPQTSASNENAVNILGYSYSTDLKRAAEAANMTSALDVRFRYDANSSNLLRRSDHWPFLFHDVPALFVHTGLHPDYHTPLDRPDTLNYDKMARIVGLVHQLSWNLAQTAGRPAMN